MVCPTIRTSCLRCDPPRGLSDRFARSKSAAAVRIRLDQDEIAATVGEPARGMAGSLLIESHGPERTVLVRLPLVGSPVAVSVFFGADERARRIAVGARQRPVVVLPTIDLLLVAGRGALDAYHPAVRTRERPRVRLPVVLAREADLQQLAGRTVVLPA